MARNKPYRIFELDLFVGLLVVGVIGMHLVFFITHYLGIWGLQIGAIDAPEFFYRFGSNFIFFRMGITLTFSNHNSRRGFWFLIMFIISCIVSFFLYYKNSLYIEQTSNDIFLYLDYTIFWYYALYIFLFMWVIKLPFNLQFCMFLVLLILCVLSLTALTMPSVNPLVWLSNILDDTIDRHINMPASKKEYLLFPCIIAFAFGTLIGQMYYKNKISPLVTEKYSNFMQRNWFTRFVMWCGANSLKCFIAQAVVLPLFFGIITLIIRLF